jgi:hypothetical protein
MSVSAVLAAGCKREEVRVYQAPKDGASEVAAQPEPPSTAAPSKPPWSVPEGWQEAPSQGGGVASYVVSAGDGRSAKATVSALQGSAGSELAVVNLWRNQVGLDAVDEPQIAPMRSMARAGTREVTLYEIAGTKEVIDGRFKARTLAAVLPAGELTVFFKLTGEDALVAAEKPKFLAWLKSVATGDDSPGEPTAASSDKPAGQPQWSAPTSWRPAGPKPQRVASYDIPGADGDIGDVSISALSGDGGGLVANINRWRGQVGLAALDDAGVRRESQRITCADGTEGTLVRLAGNEKHIVAAIIPHGSQTWFFKLTASPALAQRETEAFAGFVRSVRF